MKSKEKSLNLDPLEDFTEEQIAELIKSNEDLDQEKERIIKEEIEDARRKYEKNPFIRIRKSPIEILNRSLFFVFLGSFLFSLFLVYSTNSLWFAWYLISAFSCILYTPNRKALKELIDAWPNLVDLIKVRRK